MATSLIWKMWLHLALGGILLPTLSRFRLNLRPYSHRLLLTRFRSFLTHRTPSWRLARWCPLCLASKLGVSLPHQLSAARLVLTVTDAPPASVCPHLTGVFTVLIL